MRKRKNWATDITKMPRTSKGREGGRDLREK
jgi:hypothetical protein